MNNIFTDKVLATLRYLIKDAAPLYILFQLQVFFQITTLTELCNEIAMVLGIKNVNEFEDIGMLELSHDGNFVIEQVNVGNFHSLQFDYLDCKPSILIIILNTFVDFAFESTSY